MQRKDTSRFSSPFDPRKHELMQRFAGIEPLIRQRIREIRGPRDALLSTSDLYATVLEELVGDTRANGRTIDVQNLLRITRDSVTRACRAVNRWRKAEGSSMHHAEQSCAPPSTPFERTEFRLAMERLIDGLAHEDRELLYLRMKGRTWAEIARASGLTEVGCRQRWSRMMTELRRQFPHD